MRDYCAFKCDDEVAVGKALGTLSLAFPEYTPQEREAVLTMLCDRASPVGKKVAKQFGQNIRAAVAYLLVRFEAGMLTRSIILSRGYPIARPRSALGAYFWEMAAWWDISWQPERGFKLSEGVQEELAEEMF